ncbi:MAG: DUF996 domain-containing protein [Pyrobaculum sp.]
MDFELAKVLASVGGFVAAAGVVTHWALVIVGAVLLYLGLSAYVEREGDQSAKNNVLYWLIYVVFASVAYAAAHAAFGFPMWGGWWVLAAGLSLAVGIAAWVAGWVLQVAAAVRIRPVLEFMKDKTRDDIFKIANTLYWWGSILAIIFIGHILLLVSYLLLAISFIVSINKKA